MRNVIITGSNRGLGLEFVKQFVGLSKPPENLFATCRDPSSAEDLKKLANESKNTKIHIEKLDLAHPEQLKPLVQKVTGVVGEQGINLLVNNGAVLERCDTLADLDPERFVDNFRVNTVGPLLAVREFLPLLKQAANNSPSAPLGANRSAVVNISTKVASIDDNTSGRNYYYRTTKTALNMATCNLKHELTPQGILVLLLHPGWVRTRMGGSSGLIDEHESVSGMMKRITTSGEKEAGLLYDYKGDLIKW